ncbi:hypothetical protein TI05_02945 [Achromatium sp. WMS3]|nr:hypothetical protein TI05_02945 [Achromatium sp. WMS3]
MDDLLDKYHRKRNTHQNSALIQAFTLAAAAAISNHAFAEKIANLKPATLPDTQPPQDPHEIEEPTNSDNAVNSATPENAEGQATNTEAQSAADSQEITDTVELEGDLIAANAPVEPVIPEDAPLLAQTDTQSQPSDITNSAPDTNLDGDTVPDGDTAIDGDTTPDGDTTTRSSQGTATEVASGLSGTQTAALIVGGVILGGVGINAAVNSIDNDSGSSSGSSSAKSTSLTVDGDDTPNTFEYAESPLDITIDAKGGDDTIETGLGDDTIKGGSGNDDITTNAGDDTIKGGSGNDDITTNAGNDIVRPGQGADIVKTGAGDDTIVVVGTTTAAEYTTDPYTQTDIDALNVGSVLSIDELQNNATSEVVTGETIDGGEGNNTLVVYGDVDFTNVTLKNLTKIQVNSSITLTTAQLKELQKTEGFAIVGDGSSALNIQATDDPDQDVNKVALSFSNFQTVNLGTGVTLLANQENVASLRAISGDGAIQAAGTNNLVLTGIDVGNDIEVQDQTGTIDKTEGGTNSPPTDITLSNYTVDENAEGRIIGGLTTQDPDNTVETADVHTYTLSDDRFEVVANQLKLKDGQQLNHETEAEITLKVTSTDAGGFAVEQTFTIQTKNINEVPTAINLSNIVIDENAVGTVIGDLTVIDPDIDDTHTYTLSDGRFEVVAGQLKLKDGQALDHEAEPTLGLTVTVTDAGHFATSQLFDIQVNNINEAPTAIALSNTSVAENAANAEIGQITTTDPDADDTHTYTVSDDRFEIVEGKIKLKEGQMLDHEAEPTVNLTVTSTDANGLATEQAFVIQVSNVNEAPTGISVSNLAVNENAANAIIGNLTTVDPDNSDTHTYTINDERFEVVAGQLKLKEGQILNHKDEPAVDITVTSTDAGDLKTAQTFTVQVNNVNEVPTAINLSNTVVDENAVGTVIGDLTVIDPDMDDTHTYTLSDGRFEVVAGQLKFKDGQALDHEAEPTLGLTVTVTDAGHLATSQLFDIQVNNINEAPTAIALSNTSVAENVANAEIGQITTTDQDADDTHTYTVSDDRFEVVEGKLKLKEGQMLNHEIEPTVNLTVTSTDANGLATEQAFVIQVGNVNEAPTDIALSNTSVDEDTAGAVIGNLTTNDTDAGDTHTYTVNDDRFEVVAGQLKLKNDQILDYQVESSVDIIVTFTDAGDLATEQAFTIQVNNVNTIPTAIEISNTTVDENAVGAVIGDLTVIDPDAGDSHTYALSDARFEVVTGQLKLKEGQALDYETEPTIDLTVTVTDAGNFATNETFTIQVNNINEAATAINLSNTSVDENATAAIIGNLTATDADPGDTYTYTVNDDRFEIVDDQLKLKDGQILDHETEPTVDVTVTFTDSGNLVTEQTFTIQVNNINEAPTVIALSNMDVDENAAGAVIGNLATIDLDGGDTYTYTVNNELFEVVDNQLKLKNDIVLDHEAESDIEITVTATDTGDLTTEQTFTIQVNDVNEAPTAIALSHNTVDESADGAVIGHLATTDPDLGSTHTYTVDDARFEVDGDQLQLKDGEALDYETETSVDITVTTTDAGDLSTEQVFTINVNEVQETIILPPEPGATAEADTIDYSNRTDHFFINAQAGDDTITTGSGNDIIRPGPGVDNSNAGAGDDIFVLVGTTTANQYTQTDIDAPSGNSNYNLSSIVTLENLNANTTSEVVPYEIIDGGEGNNTLIIYGDVDLTDVEIKNITAIQINSSLTINAEQLAELGELAGLHGNGKAKIKIKAPATGNQIVDFSKVIISQINNLEIDTGVNLIAKTVTNVQEISGAGTIQAAADTNLNVPDTNIQHSIQVLDQYGEIDSSRGGTNSAPTVIALSNMAVNENAPGAIVGDLATLDPDRDDTHTYTVSDERFDVVADQLRLKTDQALNHETEGTVTLTLTSTDIGGYSVPQTFTIHVDDVNDAPIAIELSESTVYSYAAGVVIGDLTTTDPDIVDTHTYTVVGDERFEVVDGQLKLKYGVALDHEVDPTIDVTVATTDAAGMLYEKTFTIQVNNIPEDYIGQDVVITGTAEADSFNHSKWNDHLSIAAQDGDDTIITGPGWDVVRPGAGMDTVHTGAGNDHIVLVGITEADQYTQQDIQVNPWWKLDSVLSLDEVNGNSVSDVVAGEQIDGGNNFNRLVTYGDVDVTSANLQNINSIWIGDTFTITAQQLNSITQHSYVDIDGNGIATLNIQNAGEDAVEVNLNLLWTEGLSTIDIGENVTVHVNEHDYDLLLARDVEITGSGDINPASIIEDYAADPSTSGQVIVGSSVTGDIACCGNDQDWLRVELAADQQVFIDLQSSGQVYLDGIYDSNGQFVQSLCNNTWTFTADNAGDYFIAVDGYTADSYKLSVTEFVDDFTATTSTTGQLVVDGDPVTGRIDSWGDQDWFRLEPTDNNNPQLVVTLENTSGAYLNGIYDGNGNLGGNFTPYGDNTWITDLPDRPGDYFIAVNGSPSADSYQLSVAEIVDDFTANPSTTGVVTVDGEAATTGSLIINDQDWFKVELTAGEVVKIELENSNQDMLGIPGRLEVTGVYDSNGNIASVYNSNYYNYEGIWEFTANYTGDHFIAVAGDVTYSYDLNVSAIGDDFTEDTSTTGEVIIDGDPATGEINYWVDQDWFQVEVANNLDAGNEAPTTIALDTNEVIENTKGVVVGNLTTTDPNDPEGWGYYHYSVQDNRFVIDGAELKLKDGIALDYEATPTVDVTVTASDKWGLTTDQLFTINVTDEGGDGNEAPSAIALDTNVVVENLKGDIVGNLTVTDPNDPEGEGHYTYSVDDPRFEVVINHDNNTNQDYPQLKLKSSNSLDYEATETHTVNVTVTATDDGGLTKDQVFTITVLDDENVAPDTITLNNPWVIDNRPGDSVGNLTVTDPNDHEGTDHYDYSVDDSRFEVVGTELRLKDGIALDYEAEPTVEVTVTARDSGGLTKDQIFTINVLDEESHDLAIELDRDPNVLENSQGVVIGNLHTTDPEGSDPYTYTVNDSRFEVDNNQLKLKDGIALDYEATPTVNVTVTVADSAGLTHDQSFTINVTDVENIPEDNNDVNVAPTAITLDNNEIAENVTAGLIGNLTTTDPNDSEGTATYRYSVADERFTINGTELRLNDGVFLDYEESSTVDVTVMVRDSGGLTKNKTFTISVLDEPINDNFAPTAITLDANEVEENAQGAVIGSSRTLMVKVLFLVKPPLSLTIT